MRQLQGIVNIMGYLMLNYLTDCASNMIVVYSCFQYVLRVYTSLYLHFGILNLFHLFAPCLHNYCVLFDGFAAQGHFLYFMFYMLCLFARSWLLNFPKSWRQLLIVLFSLNYTIVYAFIIAFMELQICQVVNIIRWLSTY